MSRHIEQLMEARRAKPDSANNLRKVLREMMKVAVKLGWRETEPTLGEEDKAETAGRLSSLD
jgi:hypothetical protein